MRGKRRGRRAAQHLGDHAVSQQSLGLLSWNTIVILVSAMIMPTTPRKMLVASLIAASMDPLGVWIAHLRGLPVPVGRRTRSCSSCRTTRAPSWRSCRRTCCSASAAGCARRRSMGSYHLVELLGRGGMGEVWRARHRLLARERGHQARPARTARREQRGRGARRCSAGSSAKRRRRRRSARRTRFASSTSASPPIGPSTT